MFLQYALRPSALIASSCLTLWVGQQASPAHGKPSLQPAIQSFDTTGAMLYNNGATMGYSFEILDIPFHVDHLGIWEGFQTGLFREHETGIWDTSGNLIVSKIIDAGSSTLQDQFWWSGVNVTLAPGNYVIGAFYPACIGNGCYSDDFAADNVTNLMLQPSIAYGENLRSAIGIPFSKPDVTTPALGKSWFGPNFAGTPVPGPLPFVGAGVALGYSRKLKKRIKRA